MYLTDREIYSGAGLTNLIHIVVTGDTSQNPFGSSYAIPLQQIVDLVPVTTGGTDVHVISGTYSAGTATFLNNTGGTFNVTGFSTSGGTGTTYTADNGLTLTGTNIQLGGTLIKNTTITNNGFDFIVDRADAGVAIQGTNTTGTGIRGSSTSAAGIVGISSTNNGVSGISTTGIPLVSTLFSPSASTVSPLLRLTNDCTTTSLSGHGGSIEVFLSPVGGGGPIKSGELQMLWDDFANSRTGFNVLLKDNVGINKKFGVGNTGQVSIDEYGVGSFSGTPIYGLGVNAIGKVVEYTISGGSVDVYVTGGTYSSGTAVFTNNAGGTFNVTGFNTGTTEYWTSGSTWNGTNYPIKANNDSGLDATGDYSVAEGSGTTASGTSSHAEGNLTIAGGNGSHAEGTSTIASGMSSHAEGNLTKAYGTSSHAEGDTTIASGLFSHTEGYLTSATGSSTHAEGSLTKAFGSSGHAEGLRTIASGAQSHAEGSDTIASGDTSHAEGSNTIANGDYSHVQGYFNTTNGPYSHAGGTNCEANGTASFVHGSASTASSEGTIVLGTNITGATAHTVYVSPLVLAKLTTTQRNDLTPENGMLIYNTTDNKFQGYENGAWNNFDTTLA